MSSSRQTNRKTAIFLAGIILGMVGLTAASVPLYRLFCQVTGYGGTPQIAENITTDVLDQTIRIRFDASIGDQLPWHFQPIEREIEVRIGEDRLAFYQAANISDLPVVGTASFNVTPHKAGPYFSKIDCFCFTEQTLQPGQEVEMPVSFYVDPDILKDENTKDLKTITLSYTFFMLEEESKALSNSQSEEHPAS